MPPVDVDHDAFGLRDEVVVADRALGGVEQAASGQHDRMPPSLRIGQGDPLPHLERAAPNAGELEVVRHC